jgi:hypothetical protein
LIFLAALIVRALCAIIFTDEPFLIESGEIEINRGGELLRGRKGAEAGAI